MPVLTPTRRWLALAAVVVTVAAAPGWAQLRKLKPGINFFSKEQDVQLGREAAAQVEQQFEVVNDKQLSDYLERVGRKLASRPEADKYPYSFKFVNEKSINAFALPGGPAFVHTGLIAAADNESELAGVLAHEMSHVALRHGTNQATKANLIALPAMLGSMMAGNSMLGQLSQIGIGLGANSVLLKFSRNAERDADLLGARIMNGAGYNPIEMARFFEKLEAQGGSRIPQFLSDHPNPGNRVKAVEDEIRYLPQRKYDAETGDFPKIKALVAKLPPPAKKPAQQQPGSAKMPETKPSDRLTEYRGREFRVSHPDNWKPYEDSQSGGVAIGPEGGILQGAVGYGLIANKQALQNRDASLDQATSDYLARLRSADASVRVIEGSRRTQLDGRDALVTVLRSQSPYQGQTEIDTVYTLMRDGNLHYFILVAPESQARSLEGTFSQVMRSLRLSF